MREWLSIQIMCLTVTPNTKIKTKSKLRRWALIVTENEYFDKVIMSFILLNTMLLGVYWVNISADTLNVIETGNEIFSFIFTIEAVLKIFAFRSHYFK